jgi:hypothetical protein
LQLLQEHRQWSSCQFGYLVTACGHQNEWIRTRRYQLNSTKTNRKKYEPGSGKDPERELDGLAKRARSTLLFAK